MLGYLKAIYDWFTKVGESWLNSIWLVLGKWWSWQLAFAAAIVGCISFAIDAYCWLCSTYFSTTAYLLETITHHAGGKTGWSSLSAGAALLNCVFPLDYAISAGAAVMSVIVVVEAFKVIVTVYKLIPFKFT